MTSKPSDNMHPDESPAGESRTKSRKGTRQRSAQATSPPSGPTVVSRPGISAATLQAAGVRLSNTPEPNSIEIPYHDVIGKPTDFSRYRLPRVRPDGQKYYQHPGTGTRAYIPPQLFAMPSGGDLVIVEGEFKALSLIEAGVKAIGLPSFNTYTRDKDGEAQLLSGIREAIRHTKPDRVLFLGDSDTATNYEFSRNARFLAQNLTGLVVVLPRIPFGGPGKGIDDCREALGSKFAKFWAKIVASAEHIDLKSAIGALAVRLLEREQSGVEAAHGVEGDKLMRRILELAADCRREPVTQDRVIALAASCFSISRTAVKKELKNVLAERARALKSESIDESNPVVHPSSPVGEQREEPKSPENATIFLSPPADPSPDPVDGAALLDEIVGLLDRYLVLPLYAAQTLALYVLYTYAKNDFYAATYLNLSSPERRCGKTLTLRLLSHLCDRVIMAANVSEAAVFRAVDELEPCLMIDEVDTFFRDKPQLRGILNAGNVRSEAKVLRTVETRRAGKTEYDVHAYSVFGPKVFSGIGRLADTLADRCIAVPMRRKRPDETRARFLRRGFDPESIRQKCRRWADDNSHTLAACCPDLPPELNDRAADTWEPLLAVAQVAGPEWFNRARTAAVHLSGEIADLTPASLGERLLGDIFDKFATGLRHVSSADLCEYLQNLEERPWAEVCKSRPINPNKLSQLLKPYGVHSRKVRLSPHVTAQGYDRQDFEDAWNRYVPQKSVTSDQNNGTCPANIDESRDSEPEQPPLAFRPENTVPTNNKGQCSIVPPPRTNLVEELI